jgi:hypothetical protein
MINMEYKTGDIYVYVTPCDPYSWTGAALTLFTEYQISDMSRFIILHTTGRYTFITKELFDECFITKREHRKMKINTILKELKNNTNRTEPNEAQSKKNRP